MINKYYDLQQITEPINQAKPEIKAIVEQVLQLEKDRFANKKNRLINEDILKIIKENIQ